MRIFTATVLLILLCLHTGSVLFISAIWQCNRQEIAREQCINRSRPELQCKGRCQLRKQIKRVHQEQREGSEQGKFNPQIDCFLLPESSTSLTQIPILPEQSYAAYQKVVYDFEYPSPIPHPPDGVCI